jgi:histidyl-tRNA synthetase
METVKGFKDFLGEDAIKRQKIREILVKSFNSYGFEPAESPIVEYEEFVRGDNPSDEAVSDTFKLKDRGNRKLALRYELTFQLKRLAKNKKLPFKRYQIGEVFRDEPISGNRFRQFTQCDVDIIGSSIKDEAEVLVLTFNVLKELGIEAGINFNNRKLLNEILEKEGVKKKEEVIREIDKLDKLPESEVRQNLKKYGAEGVLSIFKESESFFEKYESFKEVKELKKYCEFYGADVIFLPSLARGLSYYNGTVFEIKTKGMKETVCAGGSYLVNGIQSTGIAFGLERLSKLAKVDFDDRRILIVALSESKGLFKIIQKLRSKGIDCSVLFGKPSKALQYANSKGIGYTLFIGEKELESKKFKLKDMNKGKEFNLSFEGLIKKLK